MRAGLAFWAGVIGAAVMVLGMWIARLVGATDFNFGYWWGSMLFVNTSAASWIAGFVIHLIIGGLVGLAFAAAFEAIGRSNWWLGLAGGIIFAVIAGLVVGGLSKVHPAIPGTIPDPGYFTANYGTASVIAFWIVYLVYGAIVGSMYVPVHGRKVMARKERFETRREEQPVGTTGKRFEEQPVGKERTRIEEVPAGKRRAEELPLETGGKGKTPREER